MSMLIRAFLIAVLLSTNLASIPARAGITESDNRLSVVTTFSILADMAHVIGGEHVAVYTLVNPEADVHVYQPRPKDAQRLAQADVLIINGLGFEGWIERLISASGYQGLVIRASDNVPLLASAGHDHDDHNFTEENVHSDPHAWQNIQYAKIYIDNIAEGFAAVDTVNQSYYLSQRDDYQIKLDALEKEFHQQLSNIPNDRRKLLVSHHAYRYFESAYDIEFIAAQGINSSADVSAKDLAQLIRMIKSDNITAAFFEGTSSSQLLRQVSDETGCRIVGRLYADSLSNSDGLASTYLKMMRYNLETILNALLPQPKR